MQHLYFVLLWVCSLCVTKLMLIDGKYEQTLGYCCFLLQFLHAGDFGCCWGQKWGAVFILNVKIASSAWLAYVLYANTTLISSMAQSWICALSLRPTDIIHCFKLCHTLLVFRWIWHANLNFQPCLVFILKPSIQR